MTQKNRAVFDAALALPELERAQLAEQLLESLPEIDEGLTEEQFAAELDRRRADLKQHPERAIPWSQVR